MKKSADLLFKTETMKLIPYILGAFALLSALGCSNTPAGEETEGGEPALTILIDSNLAFAAQQALLLDKQCRDTLMPRTYENGEVRCSRTGWWTSGFFPGTLWYLFDATGEAPFLERARKRTAALIPEQFNTSDHDLGFKLYNSFGNGLRLTGDSSYVPIMLTGARSLSTRFDTVVGAIMSWNPNPKRGWDYPVIIDNMMNLELLFWATRVSGDSSFAKLSIEHADKTLEHHFRPDNSSYHVVSYDTLTGEPQVKQTAQGFSDESAWARGQAWGLYGYTMAFRETGLERYREQAVKIADFILNHPNLPEDKVPYWDFNTPDSLSQYRDASAGAIISSALIELSQYVAENKQEKYLEDAEHILRSLSSPSYRAEQGEIGGFLLKHSVGSIPHGGEIDVPLSYADYYFIEAMLRFRRLMAREEVLGFRD